MNEGPAPALRGMEELRKAIQRLNKRHAGKMPTLQRDLAHLEDAIFRETERHAALLQELDEARNSSELIEQAHQEWRQSVDAVQHPIMVHDDQFRILRCNFAYARQCGLEFHAIIGRPYWECFPKGTAPLSHCELIVGREDAAATPADMEEEFTLDDGRIFVSRAWPLRDATGAGAKGLHIFEDVTERARQKDRLQRSLAHAEALELIAASDALRTGDITGLARQATEAAAAATGVERANVWLFNDNETELRCIDQFEATPARHAAGTILHEDQFRNEFLALKSGAYVDADDPFNDARTRGYVDTYLRPLGITSMLDAVVRVSGRNLGLLCLEHVGRPHHWEIDEIEFACRLADKLALALVNRERVTAQEQTRESEERHRVLFESSQEAFMQLAPPDWHFLAANPAALAMFRADREADFLSRPPWEHSPLLQPDGLPSPEKAAAHIATAMREGNHAFEWTHRRLDGQEFPATVLLTRLTLRGRTLLNATVRDITERKRAESGLRNLNRALRTLSAGNETLVRATDETALLADMCRVIVETGGHYQALVAYAGHDTGRSVDIRASYGPETKLLDGVQISWADDDFSRGPVGSAIRTGAPQVSRLLRSDAGLRPWHYILERSRATSILALPLLAAGNCFGALAIASTDPEAFNAEESRMLTELAGDLAFGVGLLRVREESAERAVKLRRSMEGTIEALVNTVERRDPYTAGHQRRVAELAAAIGRELGLGEERIAGLRFAATIHDIGKIAVPAEILARPTRLTDIEFELVKEHARIGHDIVKGVDFPWPVAEIILQHHEHLDGSGYPRGLSGDQILLDARIITVADVVEAMSSHRPYRPALGLVAALGEIVHNRGRYYDAQAVDACVHLFNDNQFTFTGPP